VNASPDHERLINRRLRLAVSLIFSLLGVEVIVVTWLSPSTPGVVRVSANAAAVMLLVGAALVRRVGEFSGTGASN
jgi:hypothetical protein